MNRLIFFLLSFHLASLERAFGRGALDSDSISSSGVANDLNQTRPPTSTKTPPELSLKPIRVFKNVDTSDPFCEESENEDVELNQDTEKQSSSIVAVNSSDDDSDAQLRDEVCAILDKGVSKNQNHDYNSEAENVNDTASPVPPNNYSVACKFNSIMDI